MNNPGIKTSVTELWPARAHNAGPGLRAPRHVGNGRISYCPICRRVIVRRMGRWWQP